MITPDRPLAETRIVVFDTETTGLSPSSDRVIEIAAVALEGGEPAGAFESLIDPGVPIPPELTAIHGITDEMVRGKPRFAEIFGRFLDFSGDAVLAAHNAPYDVSMLIVPALAAGIQPRGNPVLDTCRLARRLIESPNYRLGTLAKTLGIELVGAHRAMADVKATAGVLRACLAKLGPGATLAHAEATAATRPDFGASARPLPPLPPRLAPLEAALGTGGVVEIVYRGGSHGDRPRPVTPLFMMVLDGSVNVAAQCHLEHTLKNFRVDRIASARPAAGA